MQEIIGMISQIFNVRENWASVLIVTNIEGSTIRAAGPVKNPVVGTLMIFAGDFESDSKYGRQFKIWSSMVYNETTREGLIRYLSSGFFTGVGEAAAQRIVDTFGDEALDVIENRPIRLATIPRISFEKAKEISKMYKTFKTNMENCQLSGDQIKINTSKNGHNVVYPEECFRICKHVTKISSDVIKVSQIPKENDYVYTESNVKIRIMKEIGHGGEGHVYKTSSPFLAKIYKAEKITNQIKSKIELMLKKRIECDGICYPVAGLYNVQHEFVGYLMPLAKGKSLQSAIFIPRVFKKNFPFWKKRDLVELAITILQKIDYLHNRNIIIGDINPGNIMMVSSKEVYIVDTDSFQIEDFPCPVGMTNFTAPELQKHDFHTFLRSMGNENFAVATLLFMLMLPGKPPYSQQGGEDPVSNIINMDFSYPFKGESNKKTPDGPWRNIWSHLPRYIKEMFYCTFKKDEKYSTEVTRPSVEQWLAAFNRYLKELDNDTIGHFDLMSEEIFPERQKKWKINDEIIICKVCGKEAIKDFCRNDVCFTCQQNMAHYK